MKSPVKDFYQNKTILVTGGFGFLGKLLLAKLLRLNVVKEVLLLSRSKRGKSNEERLALLFEGFLFHDMANSDPNFKNKVKLVNGDMEAESLGMSSEDRNYVKENVEIFFHGAANLNMEGKLKQTVASNVRGTKLLLELAIESKFLQSFVFVSSAYSQHPRKNVEEKFYEPPMDFRVVLNILERFDDEEILAVLNTKLIDPSPNVYTFSKSVTEDMVRQFQDRLPVAIARPSIILSTTIDPVPGYSDTILGVLGLMLGAMTGFLRVSPVSVLKFPGDFIPADVTVNAILALAKENTIWKESTPKIINIVSHTGGVALPTANLVRKYGRMFPTKQMLRLPQVPTAFVSQFLYRIMFIIYNVFPAFVMETILKASQSKIIPIMKMTREAFHAMNVFNLTVFTSGDRLTVFGDQNLYKLLDTFTPGDHSNFPCSPRFQDKIDSFVMHTVDGIRKHFLKETDDDLKIAKKKIKIFYFVDYSTSAIFLYFVYRFVLMVFEMI